MLIKSPSSSALRIVVLGSSKSGKSAVTVRYLTKRFIGEYSSSKDFLYHQTLNHGSGSTEIEILDTSDCKATNQCLADHIHWAEAFVIIYSICDFKSFQYAKRLVEKICAIKSSPSSPTQTDNNFYHDDTCYSDEHNENHSDGPTGNSQLPVILLGNKRDLEHTREVQVAEVEEFALKYQLLFYEVSAAESFVGVSLAFQSLIREATRPASQQPPNNSAFQCSLSKEDSLRLSIRPAYCCGYLENRHLISDRYSASDYLQGNFKTNSCGSSSSSDASLKCSDKFQLNSRRKSMTVKSMFGNLFGSKSSRKKKRPSLSI